MKPRLLGWFKLTFPWQMPTRRHSYGLWWNRSKSQIKEPSAFTYESSNEPEPQHNEFKTHIQFNHHTNRETRTNMRTFNQKNVATCVTPQAGKSSFSTKLRNFSLFVTHKPTSAPSVWQSCLIGRDKKYWLGKVLYLQIMHETTTEK